MLIVPILSLVITANLATFSMGLPSNAKHAISTASPAAHYPAPAASPAISQTARVALPAAIPCQTASSVPVPMPATHANKALPSAVVNKVVQVVQQLQIAIPAVVSLAVRVALMVIILISSAVLCVVLVWLSAVINQYLSVISAFPIPIVQPVLPIISFL